MLKFSLLASLLMVLYLISILLISIKNSLIFKQFCVKLHWKNWFFILCISYGFQYLTFFSGTQVVVRASLLKKLYNIAVSKTLIATSAEFIYNLIRYCLSFLIAVNVVSLSYPNLSFLNLIVVLMILISGLFFVMLRYSQVFIFLKNLLPLKLWKRLNIFEKMIETFIQECSGSKITLKSLLPIFLILLMISILNGLWMWVCSLLVGAKISFIQAYAVFWIPFLLGKLSRIPLGLGVNDISMYFLLDLLGVASPLALSMVLIFRLFFFIITVSLGFIFFMKGRYFRLIYSKSGIS